MGNDPFSLFLADSLITNLGQTENSINSSVLFLQISKSTSFIEQYNLSPFLNQLFFVELNPITTFEINGQIGNPDGFYYYHPLVHSSVNQGITTFNSGAESLPFLFPIG
jgi:hypothetical protein